jgi:A/G-specific adenine glycosylase
MKRSPRTKENTPRRTASRSTPAPQLNANLIAQAVATWFKQVKRDLPWRMIDASTGQRNPFFSLVSELMLQQTQVSRVVEKFEPFIQQFPTPHALAAASEDQVLSAWTGLGYYRRARLLHAAAKAIVARHAGHVPRDVAALLALPGLGRYTAGAIASIAFEQPAPLVDTNVSRVLLRVGGVALATGDTRAVAWTWEQAEHIANAAHAQGLIAPCNEGLMELGALVCTADQPKCLMCPLRDICLARETGKQTQIPLPKQQTQRKPLAHTVVVLRIGDGVLLERRRSDAGLWAGLWQALTVESETPLDARRVRTHLGLAARVKLTLRDEFIFQTTHRDVTFRVFAASAQAADITPTDSIRRVATSEEIASLGMSSPMRRILLQSSTHLTPAPSNRAATKPTKPAKQPKPPTRKSHARPT